MNAEERAALELKIAGVLLDVAALAFRCGDMELWGAVARAAKPTWQHGADMGEKTTQFMDEFLLRRLNKPLSCRLLPVPGAAAGDPANLDSPYLVPCKVMEL